MARPKIQLDENELEGLAAISCTNEEIAILLGVSKDTIENRFSAAIKKGRIKGFRSIKRKLFEKAIGGDLGAMIWFGKQFMGWRDKQEIENHNPEPIKIEFFVPNESTPTKKSE